MIPEALVVNQGEAKVVPVLLQALMELAVCVEEKLN
jgi:hypothetical protein